MEHVNIAHRQIIQFPNVMELEIQLICGTARTELVVFHNREHERRLFLFNCAVPFSVVFPGDNCFGWQSPVTLHLKNNAEQVKHVLFAFNYRLLKNSSQSKTTNVRGMRKLNSKVSQQDYSSSTHSFLLLLFRVSVYFFQESRFELLFERRSTWERTLDLVWQGKRGK